MNKVFWIVGATAWLLTGCHAASYQAGSTTARSTWPQGPHVGRAPVQFGVGSYGSVARRWSVQPLNVRELPATIRIEHEDRVRRLARLSREFGAPAPLVQDDLQVDAGTLPGVDHAVPVIRVRYPERTFFDFGSAQVRPDAGRILDVLAESMRRDLPDTHLLILGHTDSVGTDEYNMRLSLRRAEAVMKELVARGVRIHQMGTVGIGEAQPIATNATEEGRALNRRVEFIISRFEEANIRVIEETPRHVEWLDNHLPRTRDADGSLVATNADGTQAKVNTGAIELSLQTGSDAMLRQDAEKPVTLLKETSRVVRLLPADTINVQLLPDGDAASPNS